MAQESPSAPGGSLGQTISAKSSKATPAHWQHCCRPTALGEQSSSPAPSHPRDAFGEESWDMQCPPWKRRGSACTQLQFLPAFSIALNTAQLHGRTTLRRPPNHSPSVDGESPSWHNQARRRGRPRRQGYSLQNFWKSACSSLRALRKTRPFSVPTTKALSSWTAMQATSAFSLESAEHCREAPGQSSCRSIPAWHPCHFPVGFFSSHQKILPSKAML